MTQNIAYQSYEIEVQPALALVIKLCQSLAVEKIDYCHWKSNEALARSASGENDLDLLVSRTDAQKFTEILYRLGFREARGGAGRNLPGILDYYGYDIEADCFVHVHVHYQLVLGNDLSKNYRIPIERPYLDSAAQVGMFRIPAPEFELVIFVFRMVLKHSTWDSILMRHSSLSPSEHREFKFLATVENLEKAKRVLEQYLPHVNQALFDACVEVLRPGCSLLKRIRIGEQVQKTLEACSRYPYTLDVILKFSRRVWWPIQGRVFQKESKKHAVNGGLLIAIVGGDGSGKSTAVDALYDWLLPHFAVKKAHLGKPRWSLLTFFVRGSLKIGTLLGLYPFARAPLLFLGDPDSIKFPGYPWLIREICTARDRLLTYKKIQRSASNGEIVICDRFPTSQIKYMDGPQAEWMSVNHHPTRLLCLLTKLEKHYYSSILPPDVMVVLKLNPIVAVQRKPGESKDSVWARNSEIWEADWSQTNTFVIDANRSQKEVLAELKSYIWTRL